MRCMYTMQICDAWVIPLCSPQGCVGHNLHQTTSNCGSSKQFHVQKTHDDTEDSCKTAIVEQMLEPGDEKHTKPHRADEHFRGI